jgi:hypothetical protein
MWWWLAAGCTVTAMCRPTFRGVTPLLWAPFVIPLWPLALIILMMDD